MSDTSQILVFAGPNGSGKSTITSGFNIIGEYINADEIKKREKCDDLTAAQIATSIREKYISERKSFTFETVLSSERNVLLLEKARNSGYKIFLVFILTNDVNINISRVEERVKKGGHDVPIEKIIKRYYKSISNLSKLIKFVDKAMIIDNSTETPELIIEIQNGRATLHETKDWSIAKLQKLCNGEYTNDSNKH